MWRILDLLFPPRSDEEIIRAMTVDSFLSLLSPKIVALTRPATIALFPFSNATVRSAIHEAKYHGSQHAFRLLGNAVAEFLQDTDEKLVRPVLVPVPLGKRRFKERGFNQVEKVAKYVVQETQPFSCDLNTELLMRTRETVSQVSLACAERERNMRGAFRAAHIASEKAHSTIILLDDVITTGATLQAAINALTQAGAQHILPITIAH